MPIAQKNIMHRQGQRCANEEDRCARYRASQLRYATKLWQCNVCNASLLRGNKSAHLKTKKHLSKNNTPEVEPS